MRLTPDGVRALALLAVLTLVGLTGCSSPSGSGAPTTTPARVGTPSPVDLRQWITEFTDRITPGGHYRVPGERDRRAVADGVRALLDGHRATAERALAEVGYGVRALVDRDSGQQVAEIADTTADGEARRGWGRVYVDLRGPARWQVQVPHPTADLRSEQLGIGLLRAAPGGVLILAGAHRAAASDASGGADDTGASDVADVAHRRDSVFAAVSDALADRKLPAVQVHGFADSSLPDEDVVVSTGKGDAGLRWARRLSGALRARELRVCEVWERYCGRLEGRTNVEGDHAAAVKVPFLHVEHSRRVRGDDVLVEKAVRALAEVAGEWGAGSR
ncbi:hypothetical protein AF335_15430 [Streptomyces eurocidicus]|uniref:Lipoprotein n=1 Tax=Streptomyces eurocidicus TaxID=66423 RepID=A0A2N8NVV2_STREU|nr:hypothetical protein [Streptomyces eurocidicus]MBB5119149.1 hypothetical protein [Streptomyces eurocidicus]MBF6050405.1 hypothetical protein [Streptomyces eurocidicus]PNE32905.1 hypothetical protein AF335_15430 [Streptomyces eurocidicus]